MRAESPLDSRSEQALLLVLLLQDTVSGSVWLVFRKAESSPNRIRALHVARLKEMRNA
jgi:hypothetical protein